MYPLPPLPYDAGALRPIIGVGTMQTHHGKHHARYVRVTNDLLGTTAGTRPLEEVVATARERGERKLFNNAAQAWNHAFFWECMTPAAITPAAPLRQAIDAAFGSLDALKERFVAEGAAHFGSGWVWLTAANGTLEIVSSHDAEQPRFAAGVAPLLVCDLWEHAYYLDYRNDRERFLRAWFDGVVNWDFAAAQYAAIASGGRYRYPLGATNGNTLGATARVG